MPITVKRAESYVDFCEDLSLRLEWETTNAALIEARQQPTAERLSSPVTKLAARVREIEAEMAASTVRIKVRALGKKRWQELAAEHPPREGNAQDQMLDVNASTFFDAVAKEPGAIFAVNELESGDVRDFDPKREWDQLADDMSDGQFGDFVQKFIEVNKGMTMRPFSRTASLTTESSGGTSN